MTIGNNLKSKKYPPPSPRRPARQWSGTAMMWCDIMTVIKRTVTNDANTTFRRWTLLLSVMVVLVSTSAKGEWIGIFLNTIHVQALFEKKMIVLFLGFEWEVFDFRSRVWFDVQKIDSLYNIKKNILGASWKIDVFLSKVLVVWRRFKWCGCQSVRWGFHSEKSLRWI